MLETVTRSARVACFTTIIVGAGSEKISREADYAASPPFSYVGQGAPRRKGIWDGCGGGSFKDWWSASKRWDQQWDGSHVSQPTARQDRMGQIDLIEALYR